MKAVVRRIGLALIGIGLAFLAIAQIRSRTATPEISHGRVPDFSLTESSGRTVRLQDLNGKVWVADFIFTSCAGTCPAMTAQMRRLQDALPGDIDLVSFSVDPRRDTPEVLARYAKQFHADPSRWMFLTGDHDTLYNLSINGFKLALDGMSGTQEEPITHSSRFVLVDRAGQIHAYYSGTEEADFKQLVRDAKSLS